MAISNQFEIQCPSCGKRIPLSDAVTGTIRENVRGEFESQHQKQQAELQEAFEELKRKEAALGAQRENIDKLVEDKLAAQRRAVSSKEAELVKLKRELEERSAAVDLEVQKS